MQFFNIKIVDYFNRITSFRKHIKIINRSWLILFCMVCSFGFAEADQVNLDSLQNVLATNTNDSFRMEAAAEIARFYSDAQQSDSIAKYFDKAAEIAQKSGYLERIAKFVREQGYYFYLGGHKELAYLYIDSARAISRSAQDTHGLITCHIHMGRIAQKFGDHPIGIAELRAGIVVCKEANDKQSEGVMLNDMSMLYAQLADNETAIELLLQAVKVREEIEDPFVATTYTNLGNAYKREENYAEALIWYQKALDLLNTERTRRNRIICLRNMGDTYTRMGRISEAKVKLKESFNVNAKISYGERNLAMYHFLMGDVYRKENQLDSAQYSYLDALRLLREVNDTRFQISSMVKLSQIEMERAENDPRTKNVLLTSATNYGEDALTLAQKTNSLEQINNAAQILMKVYGASNNASKAIINADLYGTTLDSLKRIESSKRVVALQTKFEVERKELEITNLNQKTEAQKQSLEQSLKLQESQQTIILLLVVGLLGFLALLIWIYRIYIQKKRANTLLEVK
ncbi:MAG: tetratricopeptide repeat protein, partial [Bacteroidia bacterium]